MDGRQVLRELIWTLLDALQEGDLPGHLVAWWAVVTGRVTEDTPAGIPTAPTPVREVVHDPIPEV
jgi:uncharacterized NAD(P)/FAD-binding protein YdhS